MNTRQSGNRAIGQEPSSASSFRQMVLWKDAQTFAAKVAELIVALPHDRAADVIGNQLLRAAGSIPANIAEGYGRFSQAAYRSHLSIARGSAFEAESWIDLLLRRGYVSKELGDDLLKRCSYVQSLISTRMKGLGEAKASYAREESAEYDV
jgi:four helix bundle protein